MKKHKFLNKEEKTKFQNQLSVIENLKSQLGTAALKKEMTIRNANIEFDNVLSQYNLETQKEQNSLDIIVSEFNGKYGTNSYNSGTGEIIPIPTDKK